MVNDMEPISESQWNIIAEELQSQISWEQIAEIKRVLKWRCLIVSDKQKRELSHELELPLVREIDGIPQDNENEGD